MFDIWGRWDTVKQSRTLVMHHNQGLELILLLRGEISWRVGSKTEHIQPGTIFFTLPSELHGNPEVDHSGIELLFVVFHAEERVVRGKRSLVLPSAWDLPKPVTKALSDKLYAAPSHQVPASPLFKATFAELVHGLVDGSLESFRKRALGTMVLEELRYCLDLPHVSKPNQSMDKVRDLVRELYNRYDEQWSVARMADFCDLAKSQFNENFRNMHGHSPMQFLNRLRIEKAEHLLLSSTNSVTDIAYNCGFNSSQYFATVFKQVYGVSPKVYAKTRKAK